MKIIDGHCCIIACDGQMHTEKHREYEIHTVCTCSRKWAEKYFKPIEEAKK